MGRAHIKNTLKDILPAKSQECVGKDTIKDETTANEHSMDRNQNCHSTRKEKQAKRQTYAEGVKSQQQQEGKTEHHESGAEELTLKK